MPIIRSRGKQLSDSDLAFVRNPENREFVDTLGLDPKYIGGSPRSGITTGRKRDEISSKILSYKSLMEGREFFKPRDQQAINPLILQALQQSMAQQPQLNIAGLNVPQGQPQLLAMPQFSGAPQVGGMQGGLLGSLATQGQQQIAAGQAMNPTILKAKSV